MLNPPEKQNNIQLARERAKKWTEYILNGRTLDDDDLSIRHKYQNLYKRFPERADKWLSTLAAEYANTVLRTKISSPTLVYQHMGIRVYLDGYVTEDFKEGSYNFRMLKFSIHALLLYTRDLMPNRKPKIVVSDGKKNPLFKSSPLVANPPAIYHDRIIYIDQYEVDNAHYFVHEFAHFVVDLIPKQTEPMLQQAYKNMLDFYWKKAKVRKRQLVADNPKDPRQVAEAEKWRMKISNKLGFPEYGLSNFDEFFAVLIENWKKLPVNAATYQYKSLVKNVLSRL